MCFEYDGYPEFHNAHTVKCRKPHKCAGCRKVIPKGESAEYTSGKYDGDFYAYYTCENCQRLILSIAAEEIRHGCHWDESWCSVDDIQDYISQRREPLPVLDGTVEECRQQVCELWESSSTTA